MSVAVEPPMSKLALVPALVRGALIVVGIGPFVPIVLGGVPVLDAVARLFGAWFEFQCHGDAGRSLSLFGSALPVCSRCFGIYAGLGLGAACLRPRLDVWPLRIWVGVAALVMLLDVATEMLEMRPAWTPVRVVTGLLLAYPVGSALVWSARDWATPAATSA